MNKRQTQRADQMGRIIQFVLDHTITPTIPRATSLLTELTTLHERMLDFGSEQEGGGNIFRSGSAQRRALRDEILSAVSEISGTARAHVPAVTTPEAPSDDQDSSPINISADAKSVTPSPIPSRPRKIRRRQRLFENRRRA